MARDLGFVSRSGEVRPDAADAALAVLSGVRSSVAMRAIRCPSPGRASVTHAAYPGLLFGALAVGALRDAQADAGMDSVWEDFATAALADLGSVWMLGSRSGIGRRHAAVSVRGVLAAQRLSAPALSVRGCDGSDV